MATTITDYASLTAAIASWTHNSLLTSGASPPSDGLIQAAQEALQNDIQDQNFGNYIRAQLTAYPPSLISGGVVPVPTDFLEPEAFTVGDGLGDSWTLVFKDKAWIYDEYPIRQADNPPAYIARDIFPTASFTASIAQGVATVTAIASGQIAVGQILAGSGIPTGPGNAWMVSGQTTGTGGIGDYNVSSCNPAQPTLTVSSEAMTAGGEAFVFGPYPDSNYLIQGTYYAQATLLSSSNTTNWMVTKIPTCLLAYCMVEAAKFLQDTNLLSMWMPIAAQRLKAVVDADKASSWAAATLQVDAG